MLLPIRAITINTAPASPAFQATWIFTWAPTRTKSRISARHGQMIGRSFLARQTMQQRIQQQKDLFIYDTRFAKHRILKRAEQFAGHIAGKREEFAARQQQLVARHKAHQKAQLIQNLLRTIRGMH